MIWMDYQIIWDGATSGTNLAEDAVRLRWRSGCPKTSSEHLNLLSPSPHDRGAARREALAEAAQQVVAQGR